MVQPEMTDMGGTPREHGRLLALMGCVCVSVCPVCKGQGSHSHSALRSVIQSLASASEGRVPSPSLGLCWPRRSPCPPGPAHHISSCPDSQ